MIYNTNNFYLSFKCCIKRAPAFILMGIGLFTQVTKL
jgi:hypothetical protein